MFKKVSIISICLLGLVALVAANSEAETPVKFPLKIGVITDLSGPAAALGKETKVAAEIAVEEINAKGGINGRSIELITKDDAFDASKGTSETIKLSTRDNVLAIVGGLSSAAALAEARVTGDHKVPFLLYSATATGLISPDTPFFPYTFRVHQSNDITVAVLARYVAKAGYKRPAISYVAYAYGIDGKNLITKALKEKYNIDVVAAEGNETGATDLTVQAMKLKAANPDVIVSWDLPVTSGVFVKTLKKLGWDVPYLGGVTLTQSAFQQTAGDARLGSISVDGYTEKAEVSAFFMKLKQRLGADWPESYIPLTTYDAVNLLAYAMEKAKITGDPAKLVKERQAIRDVIESTDRYDKQLSGRKGAHMSFSSTNHEGWNVDFPILIRYEKVGGMIKKVPLK